MEKAKPSSTDKPDSKADAPVTGAETPDAKQRIMNGDSRMIPGGAHGANAELGMSAMDRSDVPSGAQKPDQLDVRDTPEGVE
jgi:hypothetical protein